MSPSATSIHFSNTRDGDSTTPLTPTKVSIRLLQFSKDKTNNRLYTKQKPTLLQKLLQNIELGDFSL